MPTQVQVRGATQATQEGRTLVSRELDVNTTDGRIAVHNGSTAGGIPHVNYADDQNQEFTYAAATGTDTIAISLAKAPAGYQAGQGFQFKAANTNTGSATLNVNSLGAKTIKKKDIASGTLVVLEAGDIIAAAIYTAYYNGTDMVLDSIDGGGSDESLVFNETIVTPKQYFTMEDIFELGYIYDIYLSNFIPATDGIQMVGHYGNGSTYLASAGAYQNSTQGYNGARVDATNANTRIDFTSTGIGTAANEGANLHIQLFDPAADKTTRISWSGGYRDAEAALVTLQGSAQAAAASRTSLRIGAATGNIEADAKISVHKRAIG